VDFRGNTDALEKASTSCSYHKSKHDSLIAVPLSSLTAHTTNLKPTSGMDLLPTSCSPSRYCGHVIDSVVNLKPNIYFAKSNNGKHRIKYDVPLSAQTAMQDWMKTEL
jgi:hypothetical protein